MCVCVGVRACVPVCVCVGVEQFVTNYHCYYYCYCYCYCYYGSSDHDQSSTSFASNAIASIVAHPNLSFVRRYYEEYEKYEKLRVRCSLLFLTHWQSSIPFVSVSSKSLLDTFIGLHRPVSRHSLLFLC